MVPVAPRRRRIRRPTRRTAAVLLAVGLLVLVPACVRTVQLVRDALNGPAVAAPGVTGVHLGSGSWTLYQRTGSRHGGGPVFTTDSHGVDIGIGDVTVRRSEGPPLPLAYSTLNVTLEKGSAVYTAVLTFDAPSDDDYLVTISGSHQADGLLARPLSDLFPAIVLPAVGAGLAFLLVVVALVFVLVPAQPGGGTEPVAFAPASTAPVAPTVAPVAPTVAPGWYPDPSGAPQFRWWDGYRWTPHTAPFAPPPGGASGPTGPSPWT